MKTPAQLATTLNNLLLQIELATENRDRLNELSDALQNFIDTAPPYANALVQVAADAITELNVALISNSTSAIQKLCKKAKAQVALISKATNDVAAASANAPIGNPVSQQLASVKEYVRSLPDPHPEVLEQLDALAEVINSLKR